MYNEFSHPLFIIMYYFMLCFNENCELGWGKQIYIGYMLGWTFTFLNA